MVTMKNKNDLPNTLKKVLENMEQKHDVLNKTVLPTKVYNL